MQKAVNLADEHINKKSKNLGFQETEKTNTNNNIFSSNNSSFDLSVR